MHRDEKIPFAPADPFSSLLFYLPCGVGGAAHIETSWMCSNLLGLGLGLSDGLSGDPWREPRAVCYQIHSGKGQWDSFLEVICALRVPTKSETSPRTNKTSTRYNKTKGEVLHEFNMN